jgi:hypothetical protein
VQDVYVQALAFTFGVEEVEVQVTAVDALQNDAGRRLLQTPSLVVRAVVNFIDHKRFVEYRDILESTKGRQSLNGYFNYLLTDKESQLDNLGVQHMGIQGDFDMVSYFTTVPPTSAPSTGPSEYVDNGSAVTIEEEFEGTQMTLLFEGAAHDDFSFHRLLTKILNSKSNDVVDTTMVSTDNVNGTHSVVINLDCNFRICASMWRNQTKIAQVESQMKRDTPYSSFEIISADIGKLENGEMGVVEVTTTEGTFMLLSIGLGSVLTCVMLWKYWKVLFCLNKNLEDMDVNDYVNRVIAVEHNHALASCASLSSVYATDSEVFEGCETIAVIEERERSYQQPAPINYDIEGFAPTQQMMVEPQKRMAGGESESVLYDRRDTQECSVDVYDHSLKRVPSNQKAKIATFGSGYVTESETDITLYDSDRYHSDCETKFQSGSESALASYWSPKTAGHHNTMFE